MIVWIELLQTKTFSNVESCPDFECINGVIPVLKDNSESFTVHFPSQVKIVPTLN